MSKIKVFSAIFALGFLFCFASARVISAQGVAGYTFTPSSGTFTPLAGATVITPLSGDTDDGRYAPVPIGFTFRFDGTNFTQVSACTNGWMSFPTATNFARINTLDGTIGGPNRPFVAPFFDDHDMVSGSVSYLTTGASPNRIFTMQWLNARWDYLGTAAAISFQVKLYETTNRVQFIYRPEAGAIAMDPNSFGASIGLAGTSIGSGNYLSLNNSGTAPTTSSTVETLNISTKPANGQTYTFAPIVSASSVSVSGRVSTNDGRGLINAYVTLTDPQGATKIARTSTFGYFRFDDVEVGQNYIVSISSKRFQFTPQVVSVTDEITDLTFVAQ